MQIILLDKVVNLGNLGEIVKVKDGYARNFLIPTGRARRATVDPGDDTPDRPALKGFRALGKERPDFCQLLIPGVQCRV